jgi:photosystem II stability/assembly factor-like uncharacterized protein
MLLAAVVAAVVHGHCVGCPGRYRLDELQFVSRTEGWATAFSISVFNQHVSQDSGLLHTTDGGRHWTAVPDVETYGVEVEPAFWFVDADHGWVTWPTTNDPMEHFMRTRDGGRTWRKIRSPGYYLVHVQFFDQQAGVAIESDMNGPVFHRSSDGGATWSHQRLDLDFPSLMQFASATMGWIAGDTRPANDFVPRVLRTIDGGEHWQAGAIPASVRGTPRDMFFAGDGNGWLILWNGGPNNRNTLLRTTDGGATWQVLPLPAPQLDAVHGGFVFAGKKIFRDGKQAGRLPSPVQSCTSVGDEIWCSSGMDLLKIRP